MKQRVFRSGHSLAVVVPASFVKDTVIKAGDEVLVTMDKRKGKITYKFPNNTQLSLELSKN